MHTATDLCFFHSLTVILYFRRKDKKHSEPYFAMNEKPGVVPPATNEGYLGPNEFMEVQQNPSAVKADEERSVQDDEKNTDPSDLADDKNIYDNQEGE